MRSYLVTFALALTGASAARLSRRTGSGNENCCGFSLSVGGSPVEQLGDGQLRIYQTNLPNNSTFCLTNGDLTDNSMRGCVVETSTTYQIQCDTGHTVTPGFSVSSSGLLEFQSSTTFYACPTGDHGGYNIYTQPLKGQTCQTITVMVNGGGCVTTTTTMPPTTTKAPTTTTMPPTTTKAPTTTTMPPTTTKAPTTTMQPTCPTTTETCTVTKSETCMASTVTQAGSTVTVTQGGATVTETCTTTAYMTVTAPCTTSMAPPPPTTTSMAPPPPTTTSKAPPPPTTTPAPPPSSSAKPTTTTAGKTCPTSLTGAYQTPHLIVPVNSSSPNTQYGTSYFGTVSSTISSVFDFDIPASYAGDTCTVIFLFPTQSQLTTSSYQISGSGTIEFFSLSGPATLSTTYNTLPSISGTLLNVNAQPGNSYVVSSGPCAAGQRIGILAKASGSYSLNFFEDYNPSPIGVFLTAC